jgi:hypoxanthine phosphoribosyltransferase
MSKLDFQYLSWQGLHDLCFELFKKIEKKKLKFDRIVCISRGGLVVARIFSDFLDLPISNFTIVSYVRVGKTGKPRIAEKLGVDIKGEKILLVDEIVDHGTTLKKAIAYLKKLGPKKIVSLAPVLKPWTKIKPDFYVLETKKWIIFPYEIKETIEDVKKMGKEKRARREAPGQKFLKIGLPRKQVEYFLKGDRI